MIGEFLPKIYKLYRKKSVAVVSRAGTFALGPTIGHTPLKQIVKKPIICFRDPSIIFLSLVPEKYSMTCVYKKFIHLDLEKVSSILRMNIHGF